MKSFGPPRISAAGGFALLPIFLFVLVATATGQLAVNPSTVNFGTVQTGNTVSQSVVLSNTGNWSLTISQAAASGTGFNVSGLALPLTLAAGQSMNLSATFDPPYTGSMSGSLSVSYTVLKTKGHSKNLASANNVATASLAGTGTGTGQLAANPTSLTFANVQVGTSQAQSATLTNSGTGSLTVSGASLSNASFTLGGLTLPLTLAVGQSTSFSVVFTPQSSGTVSGNLALSSNASNTTLNLPLSGSAVSAGKLTASPSSLSFANVLVGTSQTQSATLTNSGGSSLTISQATLTGTGFTVNGLVLPLTLAAGQSSAFSVIFAPQSTGSVSGNLALTSNASNPTLNFALSGSAVTPGQLTANPSSLAFGNVQTGSSLTLTDSLTNTGGASVTISQVAVTGSGFSISGLNVPLTLNPGASVTFSALFAPQSTTSASGSITISSNAANPTLTVSLSGTGTAPGQLTLTPLALNFGSVTVGSTASQAASLSASGTSITVSSASVSNAEFSLTGISLPLTIAAGQSVPFTLTFAPQTAGTASGTLAFASNASNTPTETLSGSGTAPQAHSVSLSWNDAGSGVVGYNVYRGTVSGGPYTRITSALDTVASYSDTSVQAGQTYYYVATAVDGTGTESGYSNEAQAVVPSP